MLGEMSTGVVAGQPGRRRSSPQRLRQRTEQETLVRVALTVPRKRPPFKEVRENRCAHRRHEHGVARTLIAGALPL